MKNNQQISAEDIKEAKLALIKIVAFIVLFGGIMFWVFVIAPNQEKQSSRESNIVMALNEKGSKYIDKYTFTTEDFKAEEVIKSDYKPVYKLSFTNGDVLYIGLVIPSGKSFVDSYSIGYTLEQVQKSINQ